MAKNYLKEGNTATTSTTSPEARGRGLCNTRMLLSIHAPQLAANTMSRATKDTKSDLPDIVGPRPSDSKLRMVLGGLVRAPSPKS
jgi:hypothetical protein